MTELVRTTPTTGALAVSSGQTEWTEAQKAALGQLWGGKVPPRGDLLVLMNHAQRTGLDPFTRQLYMIERGGRWGIQTAIDGFRVVAERTGKYAGQLDPEWCGADGVWTDVWLEGTPPKAARVAVLRRDFDAPLRATVLWSEYGSTSGMWRTMPALMLAKCAEAQALRKAFPQDLSGLYTADEMAQSDHPAPTAAPAAPAFDEGAVGTVWSSVLASRSDDQLKGAWEAGKASGVLDAEVAVPEEWRGDDGEPLPERVPLGRLVIVARRRIAEGKLPPEAPAAEPETVDGVVVDDEPVETAPASGCTGAVLDDGSVSHDSETCPVHENVPVGVVEPPAGGWPEAAAPGSGAPKRARR